MIWTFLLLLFSGGSIVEGSMAGTIEVPKKEIRHALVRFLKTNSPWETAEVRIREVRIPGTVVLSTSTYDLSLHVPPNTRYLGHTPVEIVFNEGKDGQKKIWVSAYLEVLNPVVVSKRPMTRNQIISADDVRIEKRDLARTPSGAITDLHGVVGKRLKRTLAAGAVLSRAMVDNPLIVRRGDIVKIVIETEMLKISTLGRVDERGGIGDTVRVINLDSKRRVYGQVVDKRTVRVRY
jgi:flagella basal body P-ring formation protein FlgA